jgi:endonuclease/exonuclease/phosphatase family metal-dependent hydrolase
MRLSRSRSVFSARLGALLLALLVLGVAGLSADAAKSKDVGGKREVTVMTQNLYLGASLDPILEADSALALLFAVEEVWQAAQDTDFPERAEELADEIASAKPALIGLQEAALWRIQSPGDILLGGSTPAETVVYDFVEILLDELADRGASYKVVISQDNLDAELPSITGNDIRLTDRDVILARTDLPHGYLQVLSTDSGYFDTLASEYVGGSEIYILRGWVAADVKVRGKEFRFLNTHLEDDPYPTEQEAQAEELLDGPADVDTPVILVGDLNSDAAGDGTDSYDNLVDAGFDDAWWDADPLDPGLTWGHDENLLNEDPDLTQRIDFVLYWGTFEVKNVYVVGDEDGDQTSSGLWPSDHAGVVSTLWIPGKFKR